MENFLVGTYNSFIKMVWDESFLGKAGGGLLSTIRLKNASRKQSISLFNVGGGGGGGVDIDKNLINRLIYWF